jgi:hypothetical protein
MPQITVFDSQQQIVDCYIISVELFDELAKTASIFNLNQIPLNFLEELQGRFFNFLNDNFDSEIDRLQVIQQCHSWYANLVSLLEGLHRLDISDLTIKLTRR